MSLYQPVPTTVWGPKIWAALHYITLGYPSKPTEQDKANYRTFFQSMKDVLPCSICANHYELNYKERPLTDEILSDREKLIKWLIDFHNVVNEQKGKPVVPYADARIMIDADKKCSHVELFTNTSSISFPLLLMIILGALVTIAIIYKKK